MDQDLPDRVRLDGIVTVVSDLKQTWCVSGRGGGVSLSPAVANQLSFWLEERGREMRADVAV